MRKDRLFETVISLIVIFLSVIGIVSVYSAGSYYSSVVKSDPFFYVQKQFIFVVLGILSFLFILKFFKYKYFFNYKLLQRASIVMIVVLVALILFGQRINGARGWISFGFFSFQPLEIAKLIIIWATAFYFYESRYMDPLEVPNNASQLMKYWGKHHPELTLGGICLFIITAVLLQPDTGGALIILSIIAVMWMTSGLFTLKQFLKYSSISVGIGAVLLGIAALFGGDSYQIKRILVFLNPFDKALESASFQVRNSFYALSRGGFTGVGIGNSVQKTGYLPEFHTDFILAIIGEELGIFGVLFIVFLLLLLVFLIFRRSLSMKNVFNKFILIGIGTLFLIQSFLNIAGIISLAPLTGVTLPFISYGGSSILASYISIAIVVKISIMDKKMKEKQIIQENIKEVQEWNTQEEA